MAENGRFDQALRLLQAESEALIEELSTLDTADWESATNCPPWTVRLLAAHLVRGAESYLSSLERGSLGDLEPALSREQRTARMMEIAAQAPPAIVGGLRAISDRFEREFGGLPPEQREVLGYHPYGPRPARWFVEQRLAEVAFHRWDLQHSLGRAAELAPDTAGFLLPMLLEQNLPVMMGPGQPGRCGRFRLSSPAATWLVVVAPDSLTVSRDSHSTADVDIAGGAVALGLLVYGRMSLADLETAGQLSVGGSRHLADRFNEIFSGP